MDIIKPNGAPLSKGDYKYMYNLVVNVCNKCQSFLVYEPTITVALWMTVVRLGFI